jgi:hypothetical protein
MLEQKFLDRFDMERRIQSRLFCFGSGASDDDGGGGTQAGDDNVARSNPNEMRAREQEIVRQEIARGTFDDEDDFIQQVNAGNFGATQELERQAAVRQAMGQLPPAPLVSSGGISLGQTQGSVRNLGNVATAPQLSLGSNIVDLGGEVFDANTGVSMPPAPVTMTNMGLDVGPGFDVPSVLPSSATEAALIDAQATDETVNADLNNQRSDAAAARMGLMAELAKSGIVGADADQIARQASQNRSMMVGTPEMGFTPGQLASGPGAYFARYGPNAPAVMEYMNSSNPIGNVLSAITGLNTPQEDLRLGLGQPVFNSKGKIMGELSTNALGGVVYGGNRFDPGPDHPFRDIIAPGPGYGNYDNSYENQYDIEEMNRRREAAESTDDKKCPDGFIFDEDLQACRRKTKRELQADNGTGGDSSRPAGDMFFRRTSLDDAPANLPSGFDFDAANRAFTQSFAVRPSFFQRPPDLTGFTLL